MIPYFSQNRPDAHLVMRYRKMQFQTRIPKTPVKFPGLAEYAPPSYGVHTGYPAFSDTTPHFPVLFEFLPEHFFHKWGPLSGPLAL
jgi:hypothetical protein